MATATTTLDALRAAADLRGLVADALGLSPTSVTVVVEQWSAPVGMAGANPLGTTTTLLAPSPDVTITGYVDSAFGGGDASGQSSTSRAATVTIGPIVRPYVSNGGGGYARATLDVAPAGPAQRVYLLLAGGPFAAAGERFVVTQISDKSALHITLDAKRSAQS